MKSNKNYKIINSYNLSNNNKNTFSKNSSHKNNNGMIIQHLTIDYNMIKIIKIYINLSKLSKNVSISTTLAKFIKKKH
jgi:hypothetical protein